MVEFYINSKKHGNQLASIDDNFIYLIENYNWYLFKAKRGLSFYAQAKIRVS